MFSWVVSCNLRVVFARGGVDIEVVIVFAMASCGPVLIMFVARFAWLGQHSQHGRRQKGH